MRKVWMNEGGRHGGGRRMEVREAEGRRERDKERWNEGMR